MYCWLLLQIYLCYLWPVLQGHICSFKATLISLLIQHKGHWKQTKVISYYIKNKLRFQDRVTIQAIFTGHVLARILILPKISRFWLFALYRSIIVGHPPEQRLLLLAVLWCHTAIGLCSGASSWTNTSNMCMYLCISLWPFSIDPTFSRSTIGRLCTMPACYWLIITFSKYDNSKREPNTEILARTCPVKMALMVTL